MVDQDCIGLFCRLASTMLQGISLGAALYVSLVECPARAKMSSATLMLQNWKGTFPFAKTLQGVLVLSSVGTGLIGWYLDTTASEKWLQLFSTGLMSLALPWTLIGIVPTNTLLLDTEGSLKKGDEWIVNTLAKWKSLHMVRVCTSGSALIAAGFYWTNLFKTLQM